MVEQRQVAGYAMAGTGLVILVINALSYLLDWKLRPPILLVLGIVLFITGAAMARRNCPGCRL